MNRHSVSFYAMVSLGIVLMLVLLAGAAFAGGLAVAPYLSGQVQAAAGEKVTGLSPTTVAAPALQSDDILAPFESALTGVYQTALPSVVDIQVTQRVAAGPVNQFGFGSGQQSQDFLRQGEGSGFVWDADGHIITNYHVVEDAETVKVSFANGTSAGAEVIGTDADADLAVLKVDLPASELKPLVLGDSDNLKVGQLAIAIGNPYGQDFTMTSGIVSAVGRIISSVSSPFSIPEVIQTDASINPGNSGGPLLNRYGEVIGINTMIISESGSNAGIGFAIPINIARQILPTLITGEDYQYAWLGISGTAMTDEVAVAMDLPAGTRGALILSVTPGGPADEAGLRASQETLIAAGVEYPYGGDIVIAIQGKPVTDMDDLITYLVEHTRPGDKVTLGLLRAGGNQEAVTVTLGVRPAS
jgi:S1-C subfamily serine protease